MSNEKSSTAIEPIERRGITHCHPHDNKMPCAVCGRELKRIVKAETKQGGVSDER